MNQFFDDLGRLLAAAAGVEEAPALDAATAEEILELARVAAHTQERRFAPLAAYLAGIAVERARSARSAIDAGAVIRQVRTELEQEAGPS